MGFGGKHVRDGLLGERLEMGRMVVDVEHQ